MKKKAYYLTLAFVVQLLFFYPLSSMAAQSGYPTRSIEVIIPYPPGATSDLTLRYLAEKWSEFLGQRIIPLNKPGGGTTIGMKFAATAKPDGYTLFVGSDTPLIVASLGRDIGYNLDSFRIFFQYGRTIFYFIVGANSKWKTLNEFLLGAKQNPGKLTYASYGIGTLPHYIAEMISQAAGVKLTHIPYKSGKESLAAVIGGHVDLAITAGLSGFSGSEVIRPLAISADQRVYDHPEIPTLKELGYPIFVKDSVASLGAPKGVPEEVVSKFVDIHHKVSAKYEKEMKEVFPKLDLYPQYLDGKWLMETLKERERKYREMAPQIGVKLE